MQIRLYSQYKSSDILPLYEAVGWKFYCKHPDVVEAAYANSLCVLGAYDGEHLVGILRAVGDGLTILFVQDLLVLPQYQRQGIGTGLMKAFLERYPNVYQIELATDHTEKTIAFYKSLGFMPLYEIGCCGFMMNGKM